jgi:hypothetical protein
MATNREKVTISEKELTEVVAAATKKGLGGLSFTNLCRRALEGMLGVELAAVEYGGKREGAGRPKAPPAQGWGWPTTSVKHNSRARSLHYFVDGISLCANWEYQYRPGTLELNPDAHLDGENTCNACDRRRRHLVSASEENHPWVTARN